MLIWAVFALLTAAAVAAVLRPLSGRAVRAVDPEAADAAVYRDQLAELEADKERGLIGEAEASAARTEVARRLLQRSETKAEGAAPAKVQVPERGLSSLPARAVAAAIPLGSLALYLAYGSPHLPGTPLAGRASANVNVAPVMELVTRVETQLREHPEDGRGWDVIAPIYMRLERYGDAAYAFANAVRLLGETPKRLAGFAQARYFANNGIVNEEVRMTAERLLVLEPGRADALLWLAIAKEQDGHLAEALKAYQQIFAKEPANSPWRDLVDQRIKIVEEQMAGLGTAKGPSKDDIAAADQMSPADRSKLIEQMVSRLADRLGKDGKDAAGWVQLMRAYMALGRKDDAAKALNSAKTVFAGDAKVTSELEAAAKSLGIGS